MRKAMYDQEELIRKIEIAGRSKAVTGSILGKCFLKMREETNPLPNDEIFEGFHSSLQLRHSGFALLKVARRLRQNEQAYNETFSEEFVDEKSVRENGHD
jgi:hypothetical protein